jgi:hypothetical protein
VLRKNCWPFNEGSGPLTFFKAHLHMPKSSLKLRHTGKAVAPHVSAYLPIEGFK